MPRVVCFLSQSQLKPRQLLCNFDRGALQPQEFMNERTYEWVHRARPVPIPPSLAHSPAPPSTLALPPNSPSTLALALCVYCFTRDEFIGPRVYMRLARLFTVPERRLKRVRVLCLCTYRGRLTRLRHSGVQAGWPSQWHLLESRAHGQPRPIRTHA